MLNSHWKVKLAMPYSSFWVLSWQIGLQKTATVATAGHRFCRWKWNLADNFVQIKFPTTNSWRYRGKIKEFLADVDSRWAKSEENDTLGGVTGSGGCNTSKRCGRTEKPVGTRRGYSRGEYFEKYANIQSGTVAQTQEDRLDQDIWQVVQALLLAASAMQR